MKRATAGPRRPAAGPRTDATAVAERDDVRGEDLEQRVEVATGRGGGEGGEHCCCLARSVVCRRSPSATARRAREASWRAFSVVVPRVAATSANGTAKTS